MLLTINGIFGQNFICHILVSITNIINSLISIDIQYEVLKNISRIVDRL